MPQPVFINQFQKGASENANIGTGLLLGIETYSKKGVARLAKDSVKVSGSVVTDLPIYFSNLTETQFFAQGDSGKVYRSFDSGATWTDISDLASTGFGYGLIFFDGYLYAFRGTALYVCASPFTSANWSVFQTGLNSVGHFPFIYPSAYGFYFANGNKLGLLQQSTTGTAINPGTPATYNYTDNIFELPSIYEITTMSFLPPSNLVLGTRSSGIGNDTQIADIIMWDTVSKNKFTPPLRLYSNAGAGAMGVTQLINRNNTCYAVTGGNHAVFQTNGNTFNQIAEMGLRTNYTKATGEQATTPVFLDQYPSAIAMLGNKLLTGVSSSIASYPDSNYALFPLGVWSLAFMDDDTAIQCEFTTSNNITRSNNYQIGAIHTISEGRILIGWGSNGTYGIDRTERQIFDPNIDNVAIVSPMMEIATPIKPFPSFQTIEINLVRNLLAGQEIKVYARTAFDKPFTFLQSFTTATWTDRLSALKVVKNPLGNSQFVQVMVQMSTTSPNESWTPEIRTIIVS